MQVGVGVEWACACGCPWPLCTKIRSEFSAHLFVCSTGSGEKMKKEIAKKSSSFKGRRTAS